MPLPEAIAKAVWQRDGYQCKRCGKKLKPGKAMLDLHHKVFGDTSEDPARLVTVCKKCHEEIHKLGLTKMVKNGR
jgi:5-methylcytosine-specific restriction endonuclease McrA